MWQLIYDRIITVLSDDTTSLSFCSSNLLCVSDVKSTVKISVTYHTNIFLIIFARLSLERSCISSMFLSCLCRDRVRFLLLFLFKVCVKLFLTLNGEHSAVCYWMLNLSCSNGETTVLGCVLFGVHWRSNSGTRVPVVTAVVRTDRQTDMGGANEALLGYAAVWTTTTNPCTFWAKLWLWSMICVACRSNSRELKAAAGDW